MPITHLCASKPFGPWGRLPSLKSGRGVRRTETGTATTPCLLWRDTSGSAAQRVKRCTENGNLRFCASGWEMPATCVAR